MNPGRNWLIFSLIRIGLFAAVLAILLFLQINPWIAAVLAAIIAFCISYIFLSGPREEASRSLYEARNSKQTVKATAAGADEAFEDGAVDDAADDAANTEETDAASSSESTNSAGDADVAKNV